jgi:hypothetical protein
LYFTDDVYIGQVHDGKVIEVVSFDPMQGAIYYILDEHQSVVCHWHIWLAASLPHRIC